MGRIQDHFHSLAPDGKFTVLSWNTQKKSKSSISKIFKQSRRTFRNSNIVLLLQEVPKWGGEDGRCCSGLVLQGFPNSDCSIALPTGWVPFIRSRASGLDWCGVVCFSIIFISGHNIPWGVVRSSNMFDEIQKYINDCKTKYSRNMCIHLGIDLNICLDEHRDTLGDLVGPVGYSCEGRNTTHPRQAVACMLEFMQENTFTAVNTCDLEGDPSEAWTWSKSSGKKKQIDYVLSNHTSFGRGRPFTFFNNKGQWESNILNNSDHRLLVAEFRISASIFPYYAAHGPTTINYSINQGRSTGISNNFALTKNWKPYDACEHDKYKQSAISSFNNLVRTGGDTIDSVGELIFNSSRSITFECSGAIRRKLVMNENMEVKRALFAL